MYLFIEASKYGLKSLLRKRKLRKGNGLLVADAAALEHGSGRAMIISA